MAKSHKRLNKKPNFKNGAKATKRMKKNALVLKKLAWSRGIRFVL